MAGLTAGSMEEKDLIYEKSYQCPVCNRSFTAKIMKTGKAKLLGTDQDLRPIYEGIDAVKYDVQLCPWCGYATLSRYFGGLTKAQINLIHENVTNKVYLTPYNDDIYTYEEALERYKIALTNAIAKRARASEKAYICLKSAWLVRGYQEYLTESASKDVTKLTVLKQIEQQYLLNAFRGFMEARQTEDFPMCGMDEMTIDYLIAVLAVRFQKYDDASKLISGILLSHSASPRIKDKARDLKEQIMAENKQ